MKRPPPDHGPGRRALTEIACSGGGLRAHAIGQRHRLVGAVFELDGHEHQLAVAKIFQVVHFELAFAVRLVPRLARLISVFDRGATMYMLTAAAAADRDRKS